MDEAQLIGYAVLALITLGGFVTVIQKFTDPINELRVVIQELRDCISFIKKDNAEQAARLDKQSQEISDLKLHVERIETKVDMYHKKDT